MTIISTIIPLGGVVAWGILGTSGYENSWRSCKNWPHYKFIARPVYKLVASHSNTILATTASFFVTDLIMHQLLPSATKCLLNNSYCHFSWSPIKSLAWVSLALPVMYAKYKTNY